MDIPIYEAESNLIDQIQRQKSIAYTTQLEPWTIDQQKAQAIISNLPASHAGCHDNDLYYIKSVLVTTNWNKNDDVFGKIDTWDARHTPVDKPTNLEHDEKVLVGHITDVWAIKIDGSFIADNSIKDELPDIFHLVNGSVIYLNWEDKSLVERTQTLIEQIEAGQKFVSMECFFTNFDYAVITENEKFHVLARSEETAWMTKHLRAYGGSGEYNGNKIGRFLRNITFCGKGYVDKPANPDSIILNDKATFNFQTVSLENPFIEENGVFLNRETYNVVAQQDNVSELDDETIMSNNKEIDYMSEKLIEKLEARVNKLENENIQLQKDKLSLHDELTNAGVEALKAEKADLQTQLDETQNQLKSKDKDVDESKATIDKLEKELSDMKASKAEMEKELKDVKDAEVRANRVATLVDGNIDKEIATKKVDKFTNLSDEQFEELAAELIEAEAAKTQQTKSSNDQTDGSNDQDDSDDQADANADDKVLDNVDTKDEVNLTAASEDDKIDDLTEMRQELAVGIAKRLKIEIPIDKGDE